MLWSHSLPGQQVQFQPSLIVIMNLCAGDNNSLHPFINQGKNLHQEEQPLLSQPERGSQNHYAWPACGMGPWVP